MLIAARNAMMAGKSILPPGARWVEYLESTGTQWIDTGIYLNGESSFMVKFKGLEGGNKSVMGASNGSAFNNGEISFFWNTNMHSYPTSGFEFVAPTSNSGSAVTYPNPPYSVGEIYDITFAPTYRIVNGISYTNSVNFYSDYIGIRPMFIFATNRGTANNYSSKMQMWYFRIKQGTTLVRDFRPIAIGNTGYMLDLVSGEYLQYGNKGTGAFVIGPDIAGGGYKRKCIRRLHRRSLRPSARFWRTHLWKEVA